MTDTKDVAALRSELEKLRREARWQNVKVWATLAVTIIGVPVVARAIGDVPHASFAAHQPISASDMNDNFAFLRDGISSNAGTYVGWSTATSDGRFHNSATGHFGYVAGTEFCAATFSGGAHRTVHMCTSEEMVHSAMRSPVPFESAGPTDTVAPEVWVAEGTAHGDYYGSPAPMPLGLFTDCRAFTDNSGSPAGGPVWSWQNVPATGTVVGPGNSDCNQVFHIACCE